MKIEKNKKYLFIVESPNKCKTIKQFLPKNFNITSSKGHITRLADKGKFNLGLDVDNNFEPTYEIVQDKKSAVSKLKELVDASDVVILASDADREGEAIAYHLKQELKIPDDKYERVTYTSITEKAILEGIENSRKIDMDLVNAAMAREATDKCIGYRLSGVAKKATGARSVGRCQSVGLKLIVDKEKEIKDFKSKVFYELYLKFNNKEKEYVAKYIGTDSEKVSEIESLKAVEKIIDECQGNDFILTDITKKERKVSTKLPYTTSTYQQDCINKLGMSSEKATYCAQKLYEGIEINKQHKALITYIRTDSTDLNSEFVEELTNYILLNYGEEYYTPFKKGAKKLNAQEAHEAIRCLDLYFTPEDLAQHINDKDLIRVYELIYKRTVACCLSPSIYDDYIFTFTNDKHKFQMTLSELKFMGFKIVYTSFDDESNEKIDLDLKVNDKLNDAKLESVRKQTNPPHRYSESSIIKKLEEIGVGRPSTYNTIVKILKDVTRGFCNIQNKSFVPTELGIKTIDFLDSSFSNIINLQYTAELEKDLDEIAQGNSERVAFLKSFYSKLEESIGKVDSEANNFISNKNKTCSVCGSPMQIKKGPYSLFWACTQYPNCRHTESLKKY